MEKFQDMVMKQYSFIFLMMHRDAQKWKEKKNSNAVWVYISQWFWRHWAMISICNCKRKMQMQSQCEWPQSSLFFILGQLMGGRLQRRPTARKGHKHCQLHSTATSLPLWRAEILCRSTWSTWKMPAPRLQTNNGQELKAHPALTT